MSNILHLVSEEAYIEQTNKIADAITAAADKIAEHIPLPKGKLTVNYHFPDSYPRHYEVPSQQVVSADSAAPVSTNIASIPLGWVFNGWTPDKEIAEAYAQDNYSVGRPAVIYNTGDTIYKLAEAEYKNSILHDSGSTEDETLDLYALVQREYIIEFTTPVNSGLSGFSAVIGEGDYRGEIVPGSSYTIHRSSGTHAVTGQLYTDMKLATVGQQDPFRYDDEAFRCSMADFMEQSYALSDKVFMTPSRLWECGYEFVGWDWNNGQYMLDKDSYLTDAYGLIGNASLVAMYRNVETGELTTDPVFPTPVAPTVTIKFEWPAPYTRQLAVPADVVMPESYNQYVPPENVQSLASSIEFIGWVSDKSIADNFAANDYSEMPEEIYYPLSQNLELIDVEKIRHMSYFDFATSGETKEITWYALIQQKLTLTFNSVVNSHKASICGVVGHAAGGQGDAYYDYDSGTCVTNKAKYNSLMVRTADTSNGVSTVYPLPTFMEMCYAKDGRVFQNPTRLENYDFYGWSFNNGLYYLTADNLNTDAYGLSGNGEFVAAWRDKITGELTEDPLAWADVVIPSSVGNDIDANYVSNHFPNATDVHRATKGVRIISSNSPHWFGDESLYEYVGSTHPETIEFVVDDFYGTIRVHPFAFCSGQEFNVANYPSNLVFRGRNALEAKDTNTGDYLGTVISDWMAATGNTINIYVPDDVVNSYKQDNIYGNWSAIADHIKPISELEV